MKTFKKLPGALSMDRTLVVTDGIMKNLFDDGSTTPVAVIRHGIRGTQNINNGKDHSVSNIQETDTAKLDVNAKGMQVEFSIRFLDIADTLSSCAPGKGDDAQLIDEFKSSLNHFITKAKSSKGVQEIALRYARNIANGRWLWRNRTIAQRAVIHVSFDNTALSFDATRIPLNQFGDYSDDEKALAKHIESGLTGRLSSEINVRADVYLGVNGAVEVFPSQNYIDGKPKGFARSLYKYDTQRVTDKTNNSIVGYAALRDQKITNALRTFDTWYADYPAIRLPIPVEPNGASLDAQDFYRAGKKNGKDSAFNLFLKLNELDPDTTEGMFCIACLIRGGVYSGGSEDKSKKKGKSEEAAEAVAEE